MCYLFLEVAELHAPCGHSLLHCFFSHCEALRLVSSAMVFQVELEGNGNVRILPTLHDSDFCKQSCDPCSDSVASENQVLIKMVICCQYYQEGILYSFQFVISLCAYSLLLGLCFFFIQGTKLEVTGAKPDYGQFSVFFMSPQK